MNILLVEPDRVVGQTLQTALETFGHNVVWKQAAQSSMDSLDQTTPDLIILEPQLGTHNGIEFLYELRSYPEWQDVAVIIHTINSRAQDELFAKSFAALGVQAVLYKPRVTITQLVRFVKQCMPVA